MAYVIGIDGGTESLRAFVFDLAGQPKGTGCARYATRFPSAGQAEQNPEDWWQALGTAVQGAMASAGVSAGEILALGVDATSCSVVVLDETMRPLRPALIWMDVRAGEEAADLLATRDPALRVNGDGNGPVSAEWMVPKVLWLKRHEPKTYSRATKVCEFIDYLNYRLTGRYVASLDNAAIRWHYILSQGGYPRSLVAALDLPELLEKWPAEVLRPGEIVGGLTPDAAAHLGLPAGLPVAQGGADAFIGMIGMGVTRPGQLALVTGSSHLQLAVTDQAVHRRGLWGAYEDCVYPGSCVLEGGQTSTGSIVNWFQSKFGGGLGYAELNGLAAKIEPGAEGLLVLDHFQGNRTPYTDPKSRGAILGLSLAHDAAHVYRAIIEGICFGTEAILRNFQDDSFRLSEMVVCGGATRSDLWLQIHADVSGLPLVLTEVSDAPALGSGILAAYAAGQFGSIQEAAGAMVRTRAVIEPHSGRHAVYRELYERYSRLYEAAKSVREGESRALSALPGVTI